MSALSIYEEIQRVSEERFKEEDLSDCFILDILVNNTKVEVYADTDDGIKFWQCQKLSRAIEAYLDESQVLGEKYTIEVSSPGTDKPLKLERQYPRNIGRKLEVKVKEVELPIEGKLLEVNDDSIHLKVPGHKKGMFKEKTIMFEDIESTKVLISFKK